MAHTDQNIAAKEVNQKFQISYVLIWFYFHFKPFIFFLLCMYIDSLLVCCLLQVREVPGSITNKGPHRTKGVKYSTSGSFVKHIFFKGETLALSQVAIIPSLRALWKIDFNVKYAPLLNIVETKNKIVIRLYKYKTGVISINK